MEEMTTVILLRMAERILVVSLGGMAIYLGFRLFTLVPTATDGSGKLTLPGFDVVLSKVGPGVFFAAFGSGVLIWSLGNPVSIGGKDGFRGAFGIESVVVSSALPVKSTNSVSPQDRAQVKQAIQFLNCAEILVVAPSVGMRAEDAEEPFRLAKERLIESVWEGDAWGDPIAFKKWSSRRQGDIPEELQTLYFASLPGCTE